MNLSIESGSIVNQSVDFLKKVSTPISNKIYGFLGDTVPSGIVYKLIVAFIGLALIWGSTKIVNKLAKFGMIIIALLIIVGVVFSFF